MEGEKKKTAAKGNDVTDSTDVSALIHSLVHGWGGETGNEEDKESEQKTEDRKKNKKEDKKKNRCAQCERKLKPLRFIVETCKCGATVHIVGHRGQKCMEQHELKCPITSEQRFLVAKEQEDRRTEAAFDRAWRVGTGAS